MADTIVTQEEMALRRRARRRLVGAVAIALTAVLVLPMLFDPEPKPLGPEVDISIPAQDTPFQPAAAPAAPVPAVPVPAIPAPEAEPAAKQAEPTQPVASPSKPDQSETVAATPVPKAEPAKPEPAKTPVKVDRKAENAKPAPVAKATPGPVAQADVKAVNAFTMRGYFLQLGAFSSAINARQLQEKAQAAGFKAVLTDANGQFRVRVGPIAEHDKAMEIQARLKAKGFSPVLLGP